MKKGYALSLVLFIFAYGCVTFSDSSSSTGAYDIDFSVFDEKILSWDEKYKDEPFVVTFKEDIIEIKSDFSYSEEIHFVIKVQNEHGKDIGEFPLPYDKSRDVIKNIRAYTITPEGKRIRCTQIHDLNTQESFGVYNDNRVKVLTMPQVSIGCYLDIRATAVHEKPAIENCFFETLFFTETFPIKVSQRKLIVPRNIKLSFKNLNTEISPEVQYLDDKVVYFWETKGRDKITIEEHMPNPEEVSERIFISTLDSWEELAAWARSLFSKNLIVTQKIKAKVREITSGKNTLRERIQAILEYIQKEYRYVSMQLEYHGYEPHRADDVFNLKYGDCKDQTLLAMAMLSVIGVKAYPALYTESFDPHFKDRLPLPKYFNHVILCIEYENKIHYTDLLQKGYYFDEISSALAGGHVLVLNDKGGYLGRVPSAEKSEYLSLTNFNIMIREDGSALVEGNFIFARNFSNQLRLQFETSTEDEKEQRLSSFYETLCVGGKIIEQEIKYLDDPYKNIEIDLKFERPDFSKVMGNMMVFGMGQIKRLFTFGASERKYPIVFQYDMMNQDRINYTLPDGFEIVNIPENVHFDKEFVTFRRTYKKEKERIQEEQIYRLKMCRLLAEDYQDVKDLFNQITKSTNSFIIIKKR